MNKHKSPDISMSLKVAKIVSSQKKSQRTSRMDDINSNN